MDVEKHKIEPCDIYFVNTKFSTDAQVFEIDCYST